MTSQPRCRNDVTSDVLPATTYNQSAYFAVSVDDFYDVVVTSDCVETERRRPFYRKADVMCRK